MSSEARTSKEKEGGRMAGKQMTTSSKSPLFLVILALIALTLTFHSPSLSDDPISLLRPNQQPIYKPETSFVTSLERFRLAHKSHPPPSESQPNPTTRNLLVAELRGADEGRRQQEREEKQQQLMYPCSPL